MLRLILRIIYIAATQAYFLGIRMLALVHPKARLAIAGRPSGQPFSKCDLWMHVSSLGEFEQGRPLLEKLRSDYPDLKILLTFFSPSGYEVRKNYAVADQIAYLPFDTAANARRFLAQAQPRLAIFVKYDFWYFFLRELKATGISTLLISAIFRKEQPFFRWFGGLHREMLACFRHIFVQDEASQQLLRQAGFRASTVTGDTRIDRVAQLAASAKNFPLVEKFIAGDLPVMVAGSTWPPDVDVLAPFISSAEGGNWKFILAPHEIGEQHLRRIESKLAGIPSVRYSQLTATAEADARVLLIDNIGMLASLYRYGRLAYIGGGFGAGIHNTLEPIAFGLPVIFGPRYSKFAEARWLVAEGGGFSVRDRAEFQKVMHTLQQEEPWYSASAKAKSYILQNLGATARIFEYLAAEIFPEREITEPRHT
jgi:3-deoxy-D-manno-octulosonic-acid transferase